MACERQAVRGGSDADGDGIGDLLPRAQAGDGRVGPNGIDGGEKGRALRQRFQPALGGGCERRRQFGHLVEGSRVVRGSGAPGLGKKDRIGAAGAVHEQVLDPVAEAGGILHLAGLDHPFEPVRIGKAADGKRGRQPGHEAGERR